MEQNNPKAFFGVGFSFPVQVDKNTGRMKTAAYEEDIKEAIRIILSTRKGERARRPEFGCGIYEYAFGTPDFTTISAMKREVEKALAMWEPRIDEIEVNIDTGQGDGLLRIGIGYVVRSTNSPSQLTFTYDMREGVT